MSCQFNTIWFDQKVPPFVGLLNILNVKIGNLLPITTCGGASLGPGRDCGFKLLIKPQCWFK